MGDGAANDNALGRGKSLSGEDPVALAKRLSVEPLPKKFFKSAESALRDGAYVLLLDGRPARSPAKNPLRVAEARIAEALALEWNALGEVIDPAALPLTRLVNVAIDRVVEHRDAVLEEMLAYAGTDLLCYRADAPHELRERQDRIWDAFLLDLYRTHRARLEVATGVLAVEQGEDDLQRIAYAAGKAVGEDPLKLAAVSLVTTLTGSFVLALALAEGRAFADEIWQAAHVDEDWNIAQWGEDAEAAARRTARKRDFDAAAFILLG